MKDKMWDFLEKGQNSGGNPEGLESLVDELIRMHIIVFPLLNYIKTQEKSLQKIVFRRPFLVFDFIYQNL